MAQIVDPSDDLQLRKKLVNNFIGGLIKATAEIVLHQKLDSVIMSVLLLGLGVVGAGVSAFVESAINGGTWTACVWDMLVAIVAFTLGSGFPLPIGRLIGEQVVRAAVTVIISGLVIYGTLYVYEDSVDAPDIDPPRRFQISKTWIAAVIMVAAALMVGLSAMVELNK